MDMEKELLTFDELINLERKEMNTYLNGLDRVDMEKQIRKIVQEGKTERKIALTPEQFERHFRLSSSSANRGRPEKRPEELIKEIK